MFISLTQHTLLDTPDAMNTLFGLLQIVFSPVPRSQMICMYSSHLRVLRKMLTLIFLDPRSHQICFTIPTFPTSNPCSTDSRVHRETRHPPYIHCTCLSCTLVQYHLDRASGYLCDGTCEHNKIILERLGKNPGRPYCAVRNGKQVPY